VPRTTINKIIIQTAPDQLRSVGSVSALTETLYGRPLLAKIGLFLLMLGFATVNRLRLTPRITADAVAGLEQPRRITGRLARNSVYEFALGLVVLTIVGVLGTLPPASHSHFDAPGHHMENHAFTRIDTWPPLR
jgi:putative copper export protein